MNDPTRFINATCSKAMEFSNSPAVVVNPSAGVHDLVAWVFIEIELLHAQLNMVACAKSDVEFPVEDLAEMICDRLEPVRAVLNEAKGRG